MAVEQVKISELDERYASLRLPRPDVIASLRRSIEREGLLHPLVANRTPEAAVLLDGFKRLRVVRELQWEHVAVRCIAVDEAAARAAMVTYNGAHQGLNELEEAWIVQSLVRGCKLPQKKVAQLLGHGESWVSRRLLLAERLDSGVQEDMRLGLVSATAAREVARLPRGNQGAVSQAVREHALSTRQCAQLVECCLAADKPAALAAVLEDPRRYIELPAVTKRPPARDPRLSSSGEAVRQRLVRLEQAALAMSEALHRYPVAALRAEDHAVLAPMAEPAVGHLRRAQAHLEELRAAGGVDG